MDVIGNMLTSIRNAQAVGKDFVFLPHSKLKEEIAKKLKESGYILDYLKEKQFLKIQLKYLEEGASKIPAISSVKRVSKPGRRIYVPCSKIPRVLGGQGLVILSTSAGIITNQEAKSRGIGGEVLLEVW